MKEVTCGNCSKKFTPAWSNDEAMKESRELFGEVPEDQLVQICDDCFQDFKKWYDSLTPEEHEELRKEQTIIDSGI